MYAALLDNPRDFPQHFEIKAIPRPKCGKNDILIKVAVCAVCGTDVKKYFKGHQLIKSYPIIPGHELAGTIVEVGSEVRKFEVDTGLEVEKRGYREGDRVVVAPVIACEKCQSCRDHRPEACENREDVGFNYHGGFAEYMMVPGIILKKRIPAIYFIPDNVPFWTAALAEPWACAIHAQKKVFRYGSWIKTRGEYAAIKGTHPGDVVVVIGGGPLGCMHAELAKISGAKMVMIAQRSVYKLKLAQAMKVADYYLDDSEEGILEKEVLNLTGGGKADVVITACSTAKAQRQALSIVKKGGFVSLFGGIPDKFVQIPTNEIHYNGPLIGGTSGALPYHLGIALNLMAKGKIGSSKYITHLLDLDSLEKILLIKGLPRRDVPGFMSLEESVNTIRGKKSRDFFDFLKEDVHGVDRSLDIFLQVGRFKDSIVKALVVPSSSATGVVSFTHLGNSEKSEKLEELVAENSSRGLT
ncbi:MAG: alcohol dehydrogenase catalytic domain-containing protein [bacterium]